MRYLYIVLILVLAIACKRTTPANNGLSDEYAVINTVLHDAVPASDLFRKMDMFVDQVRFPPPYPKGTKKEQIKADQKYHKHYADSLRQVMDTIELTIFINKRLFRIPGDPIKHIAASSIAALEKENYRHPAITQRIAATVDMLRTDTMLSTEAISNISGYHTRYFKEKISLPDRHSTPGAFAMSRVCFNRAHNAAAILVDTYCGQLCGSGTICFLIKRAGSWKIIDKRTLWVS